jgi:thiazole tautomerase (transcriptional regulator TenI)
MSKLTPLPPLHIVTNAAVLQRTDFIAIATELLVTLQRRFALHIRGNIPVLDRFNIINSLAAKASYVGATLIVNDRADVAFAFDNVGVQLGARTLPVECVRAIAQRPLVIGYSAHSAQEALQAERDGANFVFAGSIYETTSHPGQKPGGMQLLNSVVGECSIPVLAIGGITTDRVAEIMRTGAYGIAVISAVWHAADPVQAADKLITLMAE